MGLCYLATLDLDVVLLGEMRPRARMICWGAAVVVCALGMASKPMMVTAPLARDLARTHGVARGRRRPPGGAACRALAAVRRARRHLGRARLPDPHVSRPSRRGGRGHRAARLSSHAARRHLALLPPARLAGRSDHRLRLADRAQLARSRGVGAGRWLAADLGGLGWLWRRRRAAAAFWLGFALLALAPSSSIVPIADLVFEHRSVSDGRRLRGVGGVGGPSIPAARGCLRDTGRDRARVGNRGAQRGLARSRRAVGGRARQGARKAAHLPPAHRDL